jgi:hypothetical protein
VFGNAAVKPVLPLSSRSEVRIRIKCAFWAYFDAGLKKKKEPKNQRSPGLGHAKEHSNFNGQLPWPPLGSTIITTARSSLPLLYQSSWRPLYRACWCHFKAETCVGGGPWYLQRNGTPRAHPRGPLGAVKKNVKAYS